MSSASSIERPISRDLASQSPRQSVAPPTPNHYSPRRSERSAARLAHQSGGLGVPSSNLGAPTTNPNKSKTLARFGQNPKAGNSRNRARILRFAPSKSQRKSQRCQVYF